MIRAYFAVAVFGVLASSLSFASPSKAAGQPTVLEEKTFTCVAWPKFHSSTSSLLPGQGWGATKKQAAAEAIENCLARNRTTLTSCHVTKKDCSKIVKPKQVI